MKAFVATSLKNISEAKRITKILEELNVDHQCCITEIGNLQGKELFDHYVEGISNADLFICIQKNLGRDTSVEMGIAYAMNKRRVIIIYDSSSATHLDSMVYSAAGERISEDQLPDTILRIKAELYRNQFTPFHYPNLKTLSFSTLSNFSKIFETQKFVDGESVQNLEKVLNKRYSREVIAVSSGTTGLILAIKNTLKSKKEVLVPSLTFPATIQAILFAGGKPVFVDVTHGNWTIDPKDIERKINSKTGLILPVNLFGTPCDISKIEQLSVNYKIPVIFDSCQAFGSIYNGREIGTFGKAEVFSLDATKVVSGGLGGFITTSDYSFASKLRISKNFGCDADKIPQQHGLNGRLVDFCAALAYQSLQNYPNNRARISNQIKIYKDELRGINNVKFQESEETIIPSFQMFGILIDSPQRNIIKKIHNSLLSDGIESRIYCPEFLHKSKLMNGSVRISLPITEQIANRILCLPIHSLITNDHISRISNTIKRELK